MSEIKTLGQLLNHLAIKAGVSPDDQNLVNILSNAELSKITPHSDFVKSIDENLLSINAAKDNHPLLKNQYTAQALNAFDKKMESIIDAAGFSDETVTELKGTKNTYARFELLQTKLQEQADAKAKGSTKPEDKSAMQKQLDDLLEKLKGADSEKQNAISELVSKHLAEKKDYELRTLLGGKKTKYDELPEKTRKTALLEHIETALQVKNAKLDFDENGNFTILNSDGTAFIGANHSRYTPQTFIDEILAQDKVLVVSTPPKNDPKPPVIQGGPDAPKGNNQKTMALNDLTIKAMEEA